MLNHFFSLGIYFTYLDDEFGAIKLTIDFYFYQKNRWKKRGLSAIPVKFLIEYLGAKFTVFIAIYHFDGTVAVSHLGIEMGQGINTKVGQTVAHALGISIDFIQFKPSNNLTGANSFLSGASFTSELCCYVNTITYLFICKYSRNFSFICNLFSGCFEGLRNSKNQNGPLSRCLKSSFVG